jgi:hypothetical protein
MILLITDFYSHSGVRLGCEWTARQSGLEIGRVQLCGETQIDSMHPCVRSIISSCIREPVEVARVLEF